MGAFSFNSVNQLKTTLSVFRPLSKETEASLRGSAGTLTNTRSPSGDRFKGHGKEITIPDKEQVSGV